MDGLLACEWQRCRPFIEAALERSPGLEDIEDVEGYIDSGSYMLWTGTNCAAITQISVYASRKAVTIVHAGGDKNELINGLTPKIEQFGRDMGCDLIALTGREGWLREGRKRGWRLGYVWMIKNLYT